MYCCVAYVTVMCFTVIRHKTASNDSVDGGGGSNDDNVTSTVRYCTLGLLDQCLANEQCVARRKSTLRTRSGLCRCLPEFVRDPETGLCYNGRK